MEEKRQSVLNVYKQGVRGGEQREIGPLGFLRAVLGENENHVIREVSFDAFRGHADSYRRRSDTAIMINEGHDVLFYGTFDELKAILRER